MTSCFSRGLLRFVPIVAVVLFVLSDAKPAAASACFQDLGACYQQAALKDGFWDRFLAGLDCEVDLVGCLERALGR